MKRAPMLHWEMKLVGAGHMYGDDTMSCEVGIELTGLRIHSHAASRFALMLMLMLRRPFWEP